MAFRRRRRSRFGSKRRFSRGRRRRGRSNRVGPGSLRIGYRM